jgi:hypothetical protein
MEGNREVMEKEKKGLQLYLYFLMVSRTYCFEFLVSIGNNDGIVADPRATRIPVDCVLDCEVGVFTSIGRYKVG